MNLIEKFSRYAQISRYAGNDDFQKNKKFVINDSAEYVVLSRFWDDTTSCKGYILQKLYDGLEDGLEDGDTEDNPRRDKFVVSFCGSVDAKDWVADFMRMQKPWPYANTQNQMNGVKIHTGFITQYNSVREKIVREVSDFVNECHADKIAPSITVCGHSLGGALATTCSLDLGNIFKDNISLSSYTFGSPRVLNDAGYTIFQKMLKYAYRIVNNNDIVPQVPYFGYKHVGELIHILKNYSVNSKDYYIFPLFASIPDHLIENYCNVLKTMMNLAEIVKQVNEEEIK